MYRVVLVEDEAAVRQGIVQKIEWESHGFVLAGACEDGRQALDVLEEQPVDVVITDINMPVMDGLALAEQIQRRWPETIVVILTGFGDFEYAQKAIRYRVHEYILKPVTARQLRELLDKLREELENRNAAADQVAALLDDVDRARHLVREKALGQLLAGEEPEDAAVWQELETILASAPYYVVVADVMTPEGEGTEAARECLQEALQEKGADCHCLTLRAEDGRVVILCGGEEGAQAAEKLLYAAAQLKTLPVSAGVGEGVTGLEALVESYAGAQRAFEHVYRMAPGQVLRAEKLPPQGEKASYAEQRRTIVTAVRTLNTDGAQAELAYYTGALAAAALPRKEIVSQLQKLAVQLSEYAEEEGLQPQGGQTALVEQMAKSRTLAEAVAALRRYIDAAVENALQRGDAASRQAMVAVEYIKANYADPSLSLQNVTQHLSVSTSYFSALFKNYTGVTFVDFLTQMRLKKAQELLVSTDYKNYEIAARVGYDDPGYFGSAFKKATGYSPSEYRKHYRK